MQQDIGNLKYALFATCTPARTSVSVLEIRMKSTLFCSKNRIDLSFLDLDARLVLCFVNQVILLRFFYKLNHFSTNFHCFDDFGSAFLVVCMSVFQQISFSVTHFSRRGKEYFGYSKKDIFGRSSYVMVHRLDVQHVRCKHTESKLDSFLLSIDRFILLNCCLYSIAGKLLADISSGPRVDLVDWELKLERFSLI